MNSKRGIPDVDENKHANPGIDAIARLIESILDDCIIIIKELGSGIWENPRRQDCSVLSLYRIIVSLIVGTFLFAASTLEFNGLLNRIFSAKNIYDVVVKAHFDYTHLFWSSAVMAGLCVVLADFACRLTLYKMDRSSQTTTRNWALGLFSRALIQLVLVLFLIQSPHSVLPLRSIPTWAYALIVIGSILWVVLVIPLWSVVEVSQDASLKWHERYNLGWSRNIALAIYALLLIYVIHHQYGTLGEKWAASVDVSARVDGGFRIIDQENHIEAELILRNGNRAESLYLKCGKQYSGEFPVFQGSDDHALCYLGTITFWVGEKKEGLVELKPGTENIVKLVIFRRDITVNHMVVTLSKDSVRERQTRVVAEDAIVSNLGAVGACGHFLLAIPLLDSDQKEYAKSCRIEFDNLTNRYIPMD
jgi:hypothetical protein